MLAGHMRVAERYIVYRAERAMLRARAQVDAGRAGRRSRCSRPTAARRRGPAPTCASGSRSRRSGSTSTLDAAALERELRRAIRPGIARADLARLVVLNAKALMERDAEYSRFAGRILLTYVYEETLGWDIVRDGIGALEGRAPSARCGATLRARREDRPDRPAAARRTTSTRLAAALDPDRRPGLRLPRPADALRPLPAGRQDRRASRAGSRRRSCSGCAWRWASASAEQEAERDARALDLYAVYRQRRFCSSTPTLFNAGTLHSQLSSCYLYKIEDTLSSIVGRGIAENAMCSKWAGGLGGSWTAVRGTGSHIESTNGESQGVVPFLKMHNDQLVAVNQGGKRAGLGLRVPRGLAQRHPRVPRAAPQHRRRAPAHARHEHRVLDPGPVHAARRGARDVDAVPLQRRARPARDLRRATFEARYEAYERARRRGRAARRDDARRSSCGSRCSRCCSRPATRG